MKFVTVRDLRLKPGEIWKRLEVERELIITSNGKPIALLTGINEHTMESTFTILRRTRAILAMEEMQRTSALGSISYLTKRSKLKLKRCGVAGSENRARYQCPSWNKRHYPPHACKGVAVLNPAEFLEGYEG